MRRTAAPSPHHQYSFEGSRRASECKGMRNACGLHLSAVQARITVVMHPGRRGPDRPPRKLNEPSRRNSLAAPARRTLQHRASSRYVHKAGRAVGLGDVVAGKTFGLNTDHSGPCPNLAALGARLLQTDRTALCLACSNVRVKGPAGQ